jgi:ankyrin repeat protein
MRLLVSLGVNPSHAAYDSNYTPLFYAAQYGNMRAVQYLVLEAKADINGKSRSMNALMVARSYGHRRIVRFLEEQGANDSPAPYWMRP